MEDADLSSLLRTRYEVGSSFDVVKVELAVRALNNKGILVFLLHYASIHQITHEDGSGPVVVGLLLHLRHLLLELVKLGKLGTDLVLSV